jgi:hypothetical protein
MCLMDSCFFTISPAWLSGKNINDLLLVRGRDQRSQQLQSPLEPTTMNTASKNSDESDEPAESTQPHATKPSPDETVSQEGTATQDISDTR